MNAIAPDSPNQALYLLGQDTATAPDGGVVGLGTTSCAATNVVDLMNGANWNALVTVDSMHHLVYALSDAGGSSGGVTLTVIDTTKFPALTSTNYSLANTTGPFSGMVVDPSTGKLAIYGQGLYVYDPSAKAVSQVYSQAFMTIANAFIVPTSSTSTTTRLAIIPSSQSIGGKTIIELIDLSKVNGSFYTADNDNPVVINSNEGFALVSGGGYSAKTGLIYVQVELTDNTTQELLSYNYQTPASPNETVVADTSKTKAAGSPQTQIILNDKAGAVFEVTPDVTYEYNNPGRQGIVAYAVPLAGLGTAGIPVTLLDGSAMGDPGTEVTAFATNQVTGKSYVATNDGNVFIITPSASSTTSVNLAVTGASTGTVGVAQTFNVTLSLPANSTTTEMPSGNITVTATNGSNTVTLGTVSASSAYSPNGATVSGTFPSAGTWNVVASYAGDSNFSVGASSPLAVTIAPAAVGLSLNISGNASAMTNVQQTYTIKLSLPSGVTTTNTPTGTIAVSANMGGNFTSLGTVSAASAFSANGATVTTTFTTAGTYVIAATYSGDANFTSTSGNAFTVTVSAGLQPLNLALTGPTTANVGSTHNYVVQLSLPANAMTTYTPSGNVTLSAVGPNSTTLTLGTVSAATAFSANGGTIAGIFPLTGSYSLVASYQGDANFQGVTSATLAVTATATTTTPAFQIVASDMENATATGGPMDSSSNFPTLNGSVPDTVTITVAAVNSWTGTLNLGASGPASGANIAFYDKSGSAITQIVLPAVGSVTVTAKITPGGSAALKKPGLPWKSYGERGSATLAACMLGLLFVPRGRRRQAAKLFAVVVLLVTIATTSSGCLQSNGGTKSSYVNLTLTPTTPASSPAVGVTFQYNQ
ncbi:MAG TPA: Ig-like domain-containing protein [Acidobacteriaceae bacterium]|nr:Ig-like domain-containing protein [Acidobacteriaceae bacterium]